VYARVPAIQWQLLFLFSTIQVLIAPSSSQWCKKHHAVKR
jgi:hypothetical protein